MVILTLAVWISSGVILKTHSSPDVKGFSSHKRRGLSTAPFEPSLPGTAFFCADFSPVRFPAPFDTECFQHTREGAKRIREGIQELVLMQFEKSQREELLVTRAFSPCERFARAKSPCYGRRFKLHQYPGILVFD